MVCLIRLTLTLLHHHPLPPPTPFYILTFIPGLSLKLSIPFLLLHYILASFDSARGILLFIYLKKQNKTKQTYCFLSLYLILLI